MNTPKNILLALTLLVLLYSCGKDNKDVKRNALSKENIEKLDSIIQSTTTFNEKMTIISIVMDTLDISGPNGILTNCDLRGKKSERPAYFSYYKDSKTKKAAENRNFILRTRERSYKSQRIKS